MPLKFFTTVGPRKITSFVCGWLQLNQVRPFQFCFFEKHLRKISKRSLEYLNFRYRDDKATVPIPDITHLLHDFVFQVPGQDQHIIGPCLAEYVQGSKWECGFPAENVPVCEGCDRRYSRLDSVRNPAIIE